MAAFSQRDVRDTIALVNVAYATTEPLGFAEHVVDALARLVPGEIVGYHERELGSHRVLAAREYPALELPREVAEAVTMFCAEYPLSMLRRHKEIRALKISDFVSA